MAFLELFDETLDINSTENYLLTMQVSADDLSYCLLDTIRNKYILLRSYDAEDNKYFTSENLSAIISKDDFLNRKYHSIIMVHSSPKFTLVPAPLFDPAKKEEYFTLNHNPEENQVILTSKITEPDTYIVYSLSRHIAEVTGRMFPSATSFHHTKPLLNQALREAKHTSGNFVQVHISGEFFNLFIFDDGNLKFSNTFSYRNVSDILYYVLNTYKSLNINNETPVHFSGMTEKHDDIYSAFAIYLKHIKFTIPSGNFTFSYVFGEVELQKYINLFTAVNCVS